MAQSLTLQSSTTATRILYGFIAGQIAAGAMRPLRPPQRGERNHTLHARRRECRLRPSRPGQAAFGAGLSAEAAGSQSVSSDQATWLAGRSLA
jgi:hypothetical protein